VTIGRIDLGVCPAYDYAGDGPTAVVLPGAMLGGMPAVYFAFEPLLEQGWRVILVWDEYLDRSQDHWAFVRDRAEAAIAYAGGVDLLIGKSLGCYAAAIDLPGVWLTPALTDVELVAALRRRTAPSLFVGGTEDPMWDKAAALELGEECELAGADHGLAHTVQAPEVADAVRAFSGRLGLRT
jgi:pimeloyl-ACP methyl ester carboxylesterase